jgi:hypothetical protein
MLCLMLSLGLQMQEGEAGRLILDGRVLVVNRAEPQKARLEKEVSFPAPANLLAMLVPIWHALL